MFRDDTLIKQIEKMVVALLTQRRQRNGLDEEPEVETVDDLLKEWSGMPAVLLERLDADGLLEAMSPGGELDMNRALAVGILLEEQGDARSVGVLAAVEREGGGPEIERVRAKIAGVNLAE
jgi:hypothetical protein